MGEEEEAATGSSTQTCTLDLLHIAGWLQGFQDLEVSHPVHLSDAPKYQGSIGLDYHFSIQI
jgi:hypothetical protein